MRSIEVGLEQSYLRRILFGDFEVVNVAPGCPGELAKSVFDFGLPQHLPSPRAD